MENSHYICHFDEGGCRTDMQLISLSINQLTYKQEAAYVINFHMAAREGKELSMPGLLTSYIMHRQASRSRSAAELHVLCKSSAHWRHLPTSRWRIFGDDREIFPSSVTFLLYESRHFSLRSGPAEPCIEPLTIQAPSFGSGVLKRPLWIAL